MTLWIGLIMITIGATAILWLPQRRGAIAGSDSVAFDRQLYLARMREIETDLALGRIGPREAEAARAEEARKLIALARQAPTTAPGPGNASRLLISGSLLAPAFAVGLYLLLGVPGMQDMAAATQPDRDPARQSIEQLLQRAEAQLARNPSDLRGWTVVAPVYMRLGRAEDAVTAWRNALRLDSGNVDFRLNMAEAMAAAGAGVINEEARQAFEAVLAARPGDAKARFYLAIALGQQGDHAAAVLAWRELIGQAPAQAPWLEVARAQLAEAEARASGRESGPTKEDIDAAGQLSGAERQTMIEGMVSGLADMLRDDPSDKEAWKRLIRSYVVLGKAEETTKALAEATKVHADDAAFIAEIESIARAGGASQ